MLGTRTAFLGTVRHWRTMYRPELNPVAPGNSNGRSAPRGAVRPDGCPPGNIVPGGEIRFTLKLCSFLSGSDVATYL
ncbi:hypothetical protein GCM10025781_10840 [Kocuria gwangalliensis]|uniref:Uncharacterized protein n=1 Tax=Kocuria gwangalliensis TaxID=501592 RepID=A0ABP8WW36_9MICC